MRLSTFTRTGTLPRRLVGAIALSAGLAIAPGAFADDDAPLVVAHNMVNAWNAVDADAIAELFSEDGSFQSMMMDEGLQGREAMREHFTRLLAGASMLKLELRNIAENNGTVFLERVDYFTYKGKEGSLPVVAVLDIEDGKVTAWREYYDRAALLREMGIAEGEH